MKKAGNNFAFIDSTNLHLALKDAGWGIDLKRFRVYLQEKYAVQKAFMFLGFVPEHQDLYQSLQDYGFILIFKPTLELKNGKVKGNCDAELVLQVMIELDDYQKAIIVSGDGDFHCLVKYLAKQNKLEKVLVPTNKNCSVLLRKAAGNKIAIINDLRKRLEYKKGDKKKKAP